MTANRTDDTRSTPKSGDVIFGRATEEATRSSTSRFAPGFVDDFFRDLSGLSVSSIGMGTYLGECDDSEDRRYENLLVAGRHGRNSLGQFQIGSITEALLRGASCSVLVTPERNLEPPVVD